MTEYQAEIWRGIFRENKVFKHKDYTFHNQIQTDGISVNLLFIRKDFAGKTRFTKRVEGEKQNRIKMPEENEFEVKKLADIKDLAEYKDRKLIGADPGDNDLFMMTDGNGKFHKYTSRRRRHESYANKSLKIILNEKCRHGIVEKERLLSSTSGTSYSLENIWFM